MRAQAGFDGYCKEGQWIPVRVTVENQGAGLEARVQVATKTGQEDGSIYATDVSLPITSRKQFFLYVQPPEILRNLTVSLVSEGKTLASQQLKVSCLSPESLLVGLLADDPSPYTALNAIQLQDGFVRVAELGLADLPEQAQGWDALDALVVSGVDTGALTAEQRQALEVWLAGGGQLLAIGGPRWQATLAGLDEFLPVKVSGSQNVGDLSALAAYVQGADEAPEGQATLSSGPMREGARALVWQEGVPLLAVREVGFGRAWYLAADPTLQPLSEWNGMAGVYTRLLADRPLRPAWADGEWDSSTASQALSTLSELGIPSIFLICGWLAFYVMVVGPLNFLVLRRVKRPDLAWVTVPALVVVFTALAYVSGFLTLGNRAVLNRLAVAQAWDGVETARVRGLLGVYSPRRAKYTVASGDGFLSLPFSGEGNLQTEGWLSLQENAQTVLPGVRIERGGMKAIALDGITSALPVEHDLVLSVDDKNATLSGRVTNLSQVALKDAVLVTPVGFEELGDLSPGGTSRKVKVFFGASTGGNSYSSIFSSNSSYGIPWLASGEEEKARKEMLFQAAFAPNAYTAVNWGIYLMGWLDEPLLQAGLQDSQPRLTGATLYIVMLRPSIAYGAGLLRITPPLFSWESSQPDRSPYGGGYGLPPEGYLLRFKAALPLPQETSVRILTLDLDGPSGAKYPQTSLWDFERSEWVEVRYSSWGSIDIPAPWRYVGPEGEIRLKLEGNQNDWYELYRSTVTLVVGP
ncbi:MAG: hypothetical protein Fur0043_18840 [Anaerolineales bacterium]